MIKSCDICGTNFTAQRVNALRCSDACKKKSLQQWGRDNRETLKARSALHYQDNKEAVLIRSAKRYEAHKEDIAAKRVAYRQTDAGKAADHRGKSKKQDTPCNGTIKHFSKADQCVRCGRPGAQDLEHMTPRSQGGTNYIENLTTMCAGCNHGVGGKHTMGPQDWPVFVCWFLWNETHRREAIAAPERRLQ